MKFRFLFLLLPFFFQFSFSQNPSPAGKWQGIAELPNTSLEVSFEIEQKGKKDWTGSMDVPAQKLAAVPLTEVEFDSKEKKLRFKVPDIPGNAFFLGTLNAKGDSIIGFLNQNGYSFPLAVGHPDQAEVARQAAELSNKLAAFRTFIDSLLIAQNIPGVSVAMVVNNEVVLAEGFGYRNVEKKEKADGKTLFGIGSCSKAFTTMALAMLADDGKLDWDAPVRSYLPGFRLQDPVAEEYATTIDLLTHRIGLPRHDLVWLGTSATREELFERLRYLAPNESFRSTWQYQNFMYMTAGMLAGQLNGSSWEGLVQERIFNALGMASSNFSVSKLEASGNAAKTYVERGDTLRATPYRNIDAIGPAGSINSNAEDMAKWLQLHLGMGRYEGKRLVSPTELEHMYTPFIPLPQPGQEPVISRPSYGLGWMVYHYHGHRAINHGGNIEGFSAEVFMLPEDGFGMAVMANLDATRLPTVLCFEGADLLMGFEPENWAEKLLGKPSAIDEKSMLEKGVPVAGTQPSRDLSAFAGSYSDPGYGDLEIKRAGDSLVALFNGFEFPMSHWHYDVFMGYLDYVEMDFPFNFRSGADGFVEGVEVPFELTGDPILFKAKAPARLSERAFMEELSGEYDMKVVQVKVELSGDKLYLVVPRQPKYALLPKRGTTYVFEEYKGFSVEFVMDEKNEKPVEIVVSQPGAVQRGKRL